MNILQRKMFANGDAVVNPSFEQNPLGSGYASGYEGSGYQPYELIQDIEKEGDGYVATQRAPDGTLVKKTPINLALSATGDPAEAYRRQIKNEGLRAGKESALGIIGMIGGKNLIKGAGNAAINRFGPGIASALKSKNFFNPIEKMKPGFAEAGTKGFQSRNPFNPFSYNYKPGAKYGAGAAAVYGAASGAQTTEAEVQEEIDKAEAAAAANNFDPIQTALDKEKQDDLAKKNAAKSAAEKKKAQEKKEIESINALLKGLNLKEKTEKEAFIQERNKRKSRNTGIFLNEMAKAFAGTDNLADGIAIGAANSSDAVMQADEAEELSYAKFLKESQPKDLKETTVMDVIEKYSEQVSSLEGSNLLSGKISQLKEMLLDPSKDISGLGGFFQGVKGQIQGAFGLDGKLLDRQKATGIVKFLQARMVQDLLDEKGKTISDADRTLIKELLGNLESTVSNRADIIELLNNVQANLNNSMNEQKRLISIYDRRYSDRIEELDELKIQFNIPRQTDVEQKDDATMLDPSLIQPIG
jgi:hypothetical protein